MTFPKQSDINSHDTSAAIVINHGCDLCAKAIYISRHQNFPRINIRIGDGGRSSAVAFFVHDENYGFCYIGFGNVHSKPTEIGKRESSIETIIGTVPCWRFRHCWPWLVCSGGVGEQG